MIKIINVMNQKLSQLLLVRSIFYVNCSASKSALQSGHVLVSSVIADEWHTGHSIFLQI